MFVTALMPDRLYRDGERQVWIAPGEIYRQARQVKSLDLDDNLIEFNFALTDSLNATLGAEGRVVAFKPPPGQTTSCSIENFSILLDEDQSGLAIDSDDKYSGAIHLSPWSRDNWLRRLFIEGFSGAIEVDNSATRVTIQDVVMYRGQQTDSSAGYPADISIAGSQVLVHRCATMGVPGSDSFTVVTQSLVPGPNAVVQHRTEQPEHGVEPHARWATGLLVDNSFLGGVSYRNRYALSCFTRRFLTFAAEQQQARAKAGPSAIPWSTTP
jgi:hypothetical protein